MTVVEGVIINTNPINNNHHRSGSLFKNMLKNIKSCYQTDDTLHVISVISNPMGFKRRYELMNQFIERMERNGGLNINKGNKKTNIKLYVVELVYGNQEYVITDPTNKNHLRLRCENPLWHKENMINIAVKKLLPKGWQYMAWIDADIEFDSDHWSYDAVKLLKNNYDVVQLFSVALDLNENNVAMQIFQSYGYKHVEGNKNDNKKGVNYWHPGYAWAIRRDAYDRVGGLYDLDILGSGDYRMAKAITGEICFYEGVVEETKKRFINWANKANGLSMGFVSGVIRHYYHGDKKNRKYVERNEILIDNKYDSVKHVMYDDNGLIIPTNECPQKILDDIKLYFGQRNEDDIYEKLNESSL